MLSQFSQGTVVLRGVPVLLRVSLRFRGTQGRRDKSSRTHGSDILPDVERLQPAAIRADREDGSVDAPGFLSSDLNHAITAHRRDGTLRLLCRLARRPARFWDLPCNLRGP